MSEVKEMTIEDVISNTKKHNGKSDSKLIKKAYNNAKSKHGEQQRKSGEKYIIKHIQVE